MLIICNKINNNFEVGHNKICEIAKLNKHFYIKNSYYLCDLSFLMIKLWNDMILHAKTAKTLKSIFCQKLTNMYIMYISTVLPVLKIYKTLPA